MPETVGEWTRWPQPDQFSAGYIHNTTGDLASIFWWDMTPIERQLDSIRSPHVVGNYYCGTGIEQSDTTQCITVAGTGSLQLTVATERMGEEELAALGEEFVEAWTA